MQEQQNMKFNALEDKLRLAQEEAEAQTAGVCADKRTISSLQVGPTVALGPVLLRSGY